MGRCRHTGWLRLWKAGSEVGLEITDRPERLLDEFRNPNSDSTDLLVLIGNRSKRLASAELRTQNGKSNAIEDGEVHLFVSSFKAHPRTRFMIVDTDIPINGRLPLPHGAQGCHEIVSQQALGSDKSTENVEFYDNLLHHSLFPFADVICVFVSDIGGIEISVSRLAAWLDKGPPSTSPIRPQLLLIVDREYEKHARDVFREFWQTTTQEARVNCFRNIKIVSIPCRSPRRTRRRRRKFQAWDVLKSAILSSLDASKQARRRCSHLFSARHLAEFLHHGAISATHLSTQPFDFIKASRIRRGIDIDLSVHLNNFLSNIKSTSSVKQFAIPLIASSLLLDHYPPGMHSFDPEQVFQTLYQDACFQASQYLIHISGPLLLPSEFVRLVEVNMITQFAESQGVGSSAQWHRRQLARFRPRLTQIRSAETCFSCIRRRPQYRFECGHSICQTCLRIFYCRSQDDPWVLRPEACHLCGVVTPNLSIRLLPDTSRARVLSIDGGGIRGSGPIQFLKGIQEEIGIPNFEVQRNFDVNFGTSSGALSVTSLDILGWRVEDCVSFFKVFAERAFQNRCPMPFPVVSRIPIISNLVRVFHLLYVMLVDSKYSADGLEKLLQETCGSERAMMDCSNATELGAYIGITLTNAQDGSAFIATNYNGIGLRPSNSDYTVLKCHDGTQQIPLWEIYFTPRRLGNLGVFQDGGLAFNNPASIALREVAALFPDAPEPGILVSLGTGFSASRPEEASGVRSWWTNAFPFRLSRAFWRQSSSQVAWNQLLGHQKIDKRTEHFRFDIEFNDNGPRLDEVSKMDDLGQMAHKAITSSSAVPRLARRLRAELFIFELDTENPPRFSNGAFTCVGHITCRLRAGTIAYMAFMGQLNTLAASLRLGNQVLNFSGQDTDENFHRRVEFYVPGRKDAFEIMLAEGEGETSNISGSPFTLEWLIRRQCLDAWFGTTDHREIL